MREFFQNQVHRDTRPLDNWLARQDVRVRNNAFAVESLILLHIQSLHHTPPSHKREAIKFLTTGI